jgi:hypothetical protein
MTKIQVAGAWTLAVSAAAFVATGIWTGQAHATARACSSSCPPQHQYVKVTEPSGRALWIEYAGMGSGQSDGLRSWVHSMIADGFYLRSDGTCGRTEAAACVVLVPSP